jgi:HD superfamily phosphohydrolase
MEQLFADFTEPIRDPLWKHVYLSPGLKRVVNHPRVQKLAGIKQLGPTYLVYPGATHSRLNHSLGVFQVSKALLADLGRRSEKIPGGRTHQLAFLTAALLHDLGHFPYTHSLKELSLREHEELTADFVREPELAALIRDQVGTDPEDVAAIVDDKITLEPGDPLAFYRAILSGVLDPDKLDYLNRDAYFCGVPYGIQDTEFILSKIVVADGKPALHLQGLAAVENILFSKYLMYRSVYWHRSVRNATAMIKKALYLGLRDGAIRPSDLYGLDDAEFYHAFASGQFRPFSLIADVAERRLYSTALAVPYGDYGPAFDRWGDLQARFDAEESIRGRLEKRVGRSLHPEDVIIDFPERISFEIDIPVVDAGTVMPYTESRTVFTPEVVRNFTRSIRTLRVFLNPTLAGETIRREELIEWTGVEA